MFKVQELEAGKQAAEKDAKMARSTTGGTEEREPTTSTDKHLQPEPHSELQEATGADGRKG